MEPGFDTGISQSKSEAQLNPRLHPDQNRKKGFLRELNVVLFSLRAICHGTHMSIEACLSGPVGCKAERRPHPRASASLAPSVVNRRGQDGFNS